MRSLARRTCLVMTAGALVALPAVFPAGASPSHTQITGSGSSWAANAVNQWVADVTKQGLQVVFTPTGSAVGRRDFAFKSTDFGVSDIAFQGTDPVTGAQDNSNGRKFAYLPIVAGGTSFPYNLSYAGKRIRNLRLSGLTLAEIFTNNIKYWDDPKIKADNNNKILLPHIPIIPVVHSEGSGSTYQFTAYLANQFGSTWKNYAGFPEATEYFPRKGIQQAQSGSDGVMNFITSAAGSGAIGFDEYSYALLANFPVAKVLNKAGYFTAPTQYNVAVGLTKAYIDTVDVNDPNKYLTQQLDKVYINPAVQTYPLSSYSYMIIPISATDSKTSTTAQRQTIADFLYYSICQGQAEMGPIGYSPLPVNLVQAGFGQIAKLKAADPNVDITQRNVSTCNNPTFISGQPNVNHLAVIAPKPASCDKLGAGPCDANASIVNQNPSGNGGVPSSSNNGGNNGQPGSQPTGSNTPGSQPSGTLSNPAGNPSTAPSVDSNGQPFGDGGQNNGGGQNSDIVGVPTNLAASQSTPAFNAALYILVIALVIALMVGPVTLSRLLARRKDGGT